MSIGNWFNSLRYGSFGRQQYPATDRWGRDYDNPMFGIDPSSGAMYPGRGGPSTNPSTNPSKGGNNMWGAIIGGGLSLIGAGMGASAQRYSANRAAASSDFATTQKVLQDRDNAKFQLASLMGQNRWNERIADKDLERQKEGALWGAKFLQPEMNRGAIDLAQRQTAFELGPDATKLRQQKNREGLIREAAGKRAAMSGMFGPTFMDEQAFNLGRFT